MCFASTLGLRSPDQKSLVSRPPHYTTSRVAPPFLILVNRQSFLSREVFGGKDGPLTQPLPFCLPAAAWAFSPSLLLILYKPGHIEAPKHPIPMLRSPWLPLSSFQSKAQTPAFGLSPPSASPPPPAPFHSAGTSDSQVLCPPGPHCPPSHSTSRAGITNFILQPRKEARRGAGPFPWSSIKLVSE